MGVRDHEERICALEKRMGNFCANCGLAQRINHIDEFIRENGGFDLWVNMELAKQSELKYQLDSADQQTENLAIQLESQRGDMNADLRLIVDLEARILQLQKDLKKYVEMVNHYMEYTKKLFHWCKNHVK